MPDSDSARATRRGQVALWTALAVILIWGSSFSVQKAVFTGLGPANFLFARYLMLPAAAALLLCWRFGRHWPRPPGADTWALARLGVIGHVLHVPMVTYGIHWSTPFSSAVILACGPIFTLLILHWHGLETLLRAQVGGVALASIGVLVFLSDKLLGGQWRASGGDLTLLVAAALFAYYNVSAKPMIERHGSLVVMCYATLIGGIPVALINLPAGLTAGWSQVSVWLWAGTAWTSLVAAFLGWMVWGWVNAVRGVGRTAPLMYLCPPVAGLVAWALTGETFGAAKLVGAAITMAGVAVAQFGSPRSDPVREAPPPVD